MISNIKLIRLFTTVCMKNMKIIDMLIRQVTIVCQDIQLLMNESFPPVQLAHAHEEHEQQAIAILFGIY